MPRPEGYQPEGKADTSVFPLGGSQVQPIQPQQYNIYDWFRELHDGQQRLEVRVKALEDENAALKIRVAELEEWREGLDLPDQPEDGPARPPILPPYQE